MKDLYKKNIQVKILLNELFQSQFDLTIVDNRVLLFEYFVERLLNADITKFLTEIKSLNVFSTTLKLLGNL